MSLSGIWFVIYLLLIATVLVRALSLESREPVSRAAWALILLFLPGVGIVAYVLFGEAWIPRRLRHRAIEVNNKLRGEKRPVRTSPLKGIPDRFRAAFHTCEWLTGFHCAENNTAILCADSNDAIRSMIEDFDQAQSSIHISFYIWLTDNNGVAVAQALMRAAQRNVTCRVVVDSLGSRALAHSAHWTNMQKAGVRLCRSMKIKHGIGVAMGGRIDLRNHRKIVVIDNKITYCGSQNCADPEFRVKAKYAPWVDIMLRFEGPVVRQNQHLFATDWMVETGEDLTGFMSAPGAHDMENGFTAIAFGTGPVYPRGAMSDVFVSTLYCAEYEVVVSNPYFVPDLSLLSALVACARRGVATTLILPARNDSWVVGAISKAHYGQLAKAGVRIFEYRCGLLHAKTIVVDKALSLIGSANMDRRSLDLNFENNILLCSETVSARIRQRQDQWLADADEISAEDILGRSFPRRLGDNIATLFGPIM